MKLSQPRMFCPETDRISSCIDNRQTTIQSLELRLTLKKPHWLKIFVGTKFRAPNIPVSWDIWSFLGPLWPARISANTSALEFPKDLVDLVIGLKPPKICRLMIGNKWALGCCDINMPKKNSGWVELLHSFLVVLLVSHIKVWFITRLCFTSSHIVMGKKILFENGTTKANHRHGLSCPATMQGSAPQAVPRKISPENPVKWWRSGRLESLMLRW